MYCLVSLFTSIFFLSFFPCFYLSSFLMFVSSTVNHLVSSFLLFLLCVFLVFQHACTWNETFIFLGTSFVGGVCSDSKSTSLVVDHGAYTAAGIGTHELGHKWVPTLDSQTFLTFKLNHLPESVDLIQKKIENSAIYNLFVYLPTYLLTYLRQRLFVFKRLQISTCIIRLMNLQVFIELKNVTI